MIEIINHTKTRVPRKFINQWLSLVFKELIARKAIKASSHKGLNIIFVSKAKIKKLNSQYRNKNKPTDVLSFEDLGNDIWGELILCPEIIEKQAQDSGHSYRKELAYLVLHGLLHLLGYEHEQGGESEKKMFHLQDSIFEQIDLVH